VGVGAELGIKPPACRQLLFRLARIWDEISGRPHQDPETKEVVVGVKHQTRAFNNAIIRANDRAAIAKGRVVHEECGQCVARRHN
jgi:hypothetical protein